MLRSRLGARAETEELCVAGTWLPRLGEYSQSPKVSSMSPAGEPIRPTGSAGSGRGPCHLAGRSLPASCLQLAPCWLASASCLRFASKAGSIGMGLAPRSPLVVTQGTRSTGSRGWKPEEPGDFAPRTPPSPSAARRNIPATEAFTPGGSFAVAHAGSGRGPCHLAGRSLQASCLPVAPCWLAPASCLRFASKAGSIGMGLAPRSPSMRRVARWLGNGAAFWSAAHSRWRRGRAAWRRGGLAAGLRGSVRQAVLSTRTACGPKK
jgi:hypothetical protein